MRLMKGVLTAVAALLLSAAAAQTRGTGDRPPPFDDSGRPRASSDAAAVGVPSNGLRPPTPAPTSCPSASVSCPDTSRPGEGLTYVANIAGGDPAVTPTFNWTVAGGAIKSGQGTSSITVEPLDARRSVTATVEVGGYERACPVWDSCTATPPPDAAGNRPPAVKFNSPVFRAVLAEGCPKDEPPLPGCRETSPKVELTAEGSDPDGDRLLYTYSTNVGTLSGDGPNTALDLTGVAPGIYTVTVEVKDGRGGAASNAVRIEVVRCICDPVPPRPPPCPTVAVSCPETPGQFATFTAAVSGGDAGVTPTFEWTVSGGTISGGQGTNSITIDTTDLDGTTTATVDVGGYDRSCQTSASCTTNVCHLPPMPRKLDEYGAIPTGEEKLRLDHFAIELQNDPAARGYLICYGGRRGRAGEARRRCDRARDYLVGARGIDRTRVVTVDGGLREAPATESWVVPSGATPPAPTPTAGRRVASSAPPPRRARRR